MVKAWWRIASYVSYWGRELVLIINLKQDTMSTLLWHECLYWYLPFAEYGWMWWSRSIWSFSSWSILDEFFFQGMPWCLRYITVCSTTIILLDLIRLPTNSYAKMSHWTHHYFARALQIVFFFFLWFKTFSEVLKEPLLSWENVWGINFWFTIGTSTGHPCKKNLTMCSF